MCGRIVKIRPGRTLQLGAESLTERGYWGPPAMKSVDDEREAIHPRGVQRRHIDFAIVIPDGAFLENSPGGHTNHPNEVRIGTTPFKTYERFEIGERNPPMQARPALKARRRFVPGVPKEFGGRHRLNERLQRSVSGTRILVRPSPASESLAAWNARRAYHPTPRSFGKRGAIGNSRTSSSGGTCAGPAGTIEPQN
jgi:hypothetical protein